MTLILALIAMALTEPKPITCTVTGSTTVTCPIRNPIPECANSKRRFCQTVTIASVNWDNEAFSEWLLVSKHWNLPLERVTPVVGQELKVIETDGGQFVPLASCGVRVHRRVNEWAANHPGERVPFTIMEPPADCQPTKELK